MVANAIKFTATGGVSLQVEPGPDGSSAAVRFTVRDTGIGFSDAVKEQLFRRFQQADSTITKRFGGSGLGLAICRELVDKMNGALSAEGSPGEGSRFTFEIPLPRASAPLPTRSDEARAGLRVSGDRNLTRVLVAEDNAINRRVVELILEEAEIDLVFVENGQEALDVYSTGLFDLILMDMHMPIMDGLVATAEIRCAELEAQAFRTPIIMLTANGMPEHVRAAQIAGADGFVTKPIQAAHLFQEITRILEAPSLGSSINGRRAASVGK